MRAAAVLSLALVAGATSLAGRQSPAPPTRSHHPDIPYQSPTSLGAASYAKVLCSGVFVSGREESEVRENSAYFLMTEPDRKKPITARRRSTGEARARHRRRRDPRRPRSTAIRAASSIPKGTTASTSRRCRCGPRCPTPPASRGRWAMRRPRRRGRPSSTAPTVQAAVDLGVCRSRRADGGDGRGAQGPDRRRALHAGHHQGHAARKLVDGQEPHRYAGRTGGEGRRVRPRRPRAGARLAAPRRSARRDPRARRDADVERPQLHRPGRPLDGSRPGSTTTTSSSTRARWTPSSTPITSPVEFAPDTVGRYRNSDPMTLGFLVRQAVEKTRRAVPDLAAAGALRPDRDPAAGARARPVGQLPAERLRLRHRAQLGAARHAVSAGRHVERPAAAARRLGDVRQHAGAGVEAHGVRRPVLGERRGAVEPAARRLLHVRRRRAAHLRRARRTTWSSCAWVTSAVRRSAPSCSTSRWPRSLRPWTRRADGSGGAQAKGAQRRPHAHRARIR